MTTPGCNAGQTVTGVPGQTHWLGKGAVAADGHGNVVYVALANNQHGTTPVNWVVAMVSTNDGRNYLLPAQLVNVAGGACDPATEDMPDVTVDMTTQPETFWFAWRHKSASSFGVCVHRAVLNAGSLTWLDQGAAWIAKTI